MENHTRDLRGPGEALLTETNAKRRAGTVVLTTGAVLLAMVGGAHAGGPRGTDSSENAGRDGKEIFAHVSITQSGGPAGGAGGGSLTSTSTTWSPPPCYYAPRFTPTEFKKYFEEYKNKAPLHSGKGEFVAMHEETYGEDSEYKDHNIDEEGNGMWWTGQMNTAHPDLEARLACDEPPFWVDFGDSPPSIPGMITTEMLAEMAYQSLRVPDTDVELNPTDVQTVSLDTWAWLDSGTFSPVSVTAELDGWNLSATTVATPAGLTIEPGTEDAVVYPSSGACPVGADGGIGTPYRKGYGDRTPSCGMRYLRATTKRAPYPMRATVTWEVSWTGSDGGGESLPDGTFGSTRDVTVQEIQSIVR